MALKKSDLMRELDDEVSAMLVKLDSDHAMYQQVHRKYYGKEDEQADQIYKLLVEQCKSIVQKMKKY